MTETLSLDPAETALIVVDLQNDFCAPDGFYGRAGKDVAALAAAVAPSLALLARARDAGATVVFTRIVSHPEAGQTEQRHRIMPRGWSAGVRLLPGTWGAALVDGIDARADELVVDKAGYSAFHATGLEAHLRSRGVRTVVLCGVVTYACVLATGFAAFDAGFDVVLAADATGSWMPGLGPAAQEVAGLLLGRVLDAEAVVFAAPPSPASGRGFNRAARPCRVR